MSNPSAASVSCPGCSGVVVAPAPELPVGCCSSCGGFVSLRPVSYRVACAVVALDAPMAAGAPDDEARYFDLVVERDDAPAYRVHGFCDRYRRVVQYG